MGVHNTEIFLNVGLCCFYSQQYDIALNCLLRALSLASNDQRADVWYNIGLVALVSTDLLRLTSTTGSNTAHHASPPFPSPPLSPPPHVCS